MASSARVVAAAMASLAVLMLLLFMPGASAAGAVVPSIDATRTRHLPLPRGLLRGPESVAFDAKGQGPYSGVSDGRVLKWNGDKVGWTTYTYSPDTAARRARHPSFGRRLPPRASAAARSVSGSTSSPDTYTSPTHTKGSCGSRRAAGRPRC
ncbi:hypothetical protein ACQ4PT_013100 [Festuca glaucescens]